MNLIKTKLASSMKVNTLAAIVLCSLSACNGGSGTSGNSTSNDTATTSSKTSSTITKNNSYPMQIGSGVDSITHTATSGQTCMANASDQNNIKIGSPTAFLSNDKQSMSSLQSALNVDVTGHYGGDRFSSSVAAQFANSSKDTLYTTNFLYLYRYASTAVFKSGSLGYGLDALTPDAASLAQTAPTEFRTICGNEFAEQMDAGSVLGMRLTLSFNSNLDQKQFLAQMKKTAGLTNISTEIQQAAASTNIKVKVTLSAIQQGGQPEKLNQVFGETGSISSYPSTQCVIEDSSNGTTTCDALVNNLITYSKTMAEQLTNSDGSLKLDALYYTNPVLTPYSKLGISVQGAPDPSADVLNAMSKLTSDYDKSVYNYDFSSHYLTNLSGKLDNSTKQSLSDTEQKLGNQINNVYLSPDYDVVDCYRGYVTSQCLTIQDNVEKALVPYTPSTEETTLIDYLENNAYSGDLMSYYGSATPTATDYHMSDSECTFAPVSSPNKKLYAINCNGQWLTTYNPNGVTIIPTAFGVTRLNVMDLVYISTAPNDTTNGQLISYYDLALPADNSDDRYFYSDAINVFAPQYTTSTANLGLFRLYENPI